MTQVMQGEHGTRVAGVLESPRSINERTPLFYNIHSCQEAGTVFPKESRKLIFIFI